MASPISRRKFAGLFLAAGAGALLAACSNNSSTGTASPTAAPTSGTTGSAPAPTTAANATAAPAQSSTGNAKPGSEIHYLCRQDIVTAYGAEATIKGFQDSHPGITIALDKPPQDTSTLLTKLRAAIASNSLVWDGYSVMVAPWDTAEWVDAQVIQPLDGLISSSGEKDAPQILPGIIPTIKEASSYKGKVYAIPGNVGSVVLQWYWEPLKGIGLTKQPETWDEAYAAAKKIKEQYPKWIPFAQNGTPLCGYFTLMFAAIPSKELFTQDGLLNLQSQGSLDALNWMKKLVKEDLMPATDKNVNEDWDRKTVAMLLSYDVKGEGAQKTYGYDAAATGSNIFPKAGELNSGTPFWMNSSVVFNKAKNPQGIMDFYIWWFGPSNEAAQQTLVATAAKPCYSYTYDKYVKGNDKFGWEQTGIDLVAKSTPFPVNKLFNIQSDAIKPWVDKFLAKDSTMTADDAVKNMSKDVSDKVAAQQG